MTQIEIDKEEILKGFKSFTLNNYNEEQYKIINSFLVDNLPEYPDYE